MDPAATASFGSTWADHRNDIGFRWQPKSINYVSQHIENTRRIENDQENTTAPIEQSE